MNTPNVETKTMPCSDCGENFEAKIIKGFGMQARPLSTLCFICRDKKRTELEIREKAQNELRDKARRESWLRESGIPPKFMKESLETFEDRGGNTHERLTICQEYSHNFPAVHCQGYKSLMLVSPNSWGVGKSHLACGIAKEVIGKWCGMMLPVYYATEQVILRRVRATYSQNNSETEEQLFNHLANVPLLIVDDMGKEEVADPRFVQRTWFSIINGRYENELPMVITANLTSDSVAKHLGGNRNSEATFDRLWEMIVGVMYEVKATKSKRRELD